MGSTTDVFDQLVAAGSRLPLLPDAESAGACAARTLLIPPGVRAAAARLDGVEFLAGNWHGAWQDLDAAALEPGEEGPHWHGLGAGGEVYILPVATRHHRYGALYLLCDQRAALAPFAPFVGNLAVSLALTLDNRRQRAEIAAANEALAAAQAALRVRRTEYQLLFDAMSSGFAVHEIITDNTGHPVDYRFLEVNAAFEDLTGLRADAVIGHTALEVIPGLERAWVERYGEVALTGRPASFEAYAAALDRSFEVIAYSPSPRRFATLFIDVSERRRAEIERRRHADALHARSLIEASLDPFVTISEDGTITDVNAAAERVTGVPRAELIGTDFSEYFTEPQKARAGYRRVFEEGAVRDYALSIRHRDGYVTDVLYNASLYRNVAGEVEGVFATARDVTELKRAQDAVLANARAAERQRQIATALQENFVHPLPVVPGLELAVLSLPASRDELVGGDFHDVFRLSGGRVVALIGDVAGKGARAAGLTETVRSGVRTLAPISPAPGFILSHVNRMLLEEDEHRQLVTALLVVLDPQSGLASAASAGHPPAVHLTAAGCNTVEPVYGLPLGALEQSFAATEFTVAPGDALVLYTDGLTEARRRGELFGERRVLDVVRAAPTAEPAELIERLRDAVVAWASELQDDLQILVLRRTA